VLEIDPRLLTIAQAAERLGLSRSKLYELIAAGEISTVRIGRSRRIIPDDLASFIDSRRQVATG
jgi:excisionase family DNA binding protein